MCGVLSGMVFAVYNFLRIKGLTGEICVTLVNLRRSIKEKDWIKIWTSFAMVVTIESVCLLIPLLNTHVVLIVFNNECEVVNIIEDVVQSHV